jgi:hypothetical protein
VQDPPPSDLVTQWSGVRSAPSVSRPRGRSGPNPSKSTDIEQSTDSNTLLLQTLNSAMTVFAKSLSSTSPATNSGNHCRSSPPPPIEDDLEVCLSAFQKYKGVPADVVAVAMSAFCEVSYNPDAICEATCERLQEISGLAKGHVLMLKKFVRGWCGKVDAKRAKRSM